MTGASTASQNTGREVGREASPRRVTRRGVLGGSFVLAGTALGGAALGGAAVGPTVPDRNTEPGPRNVTPQIVPFHGPHQAGVVEAHQRHAAFVGLRLRPDVDHPRLVALLRMLTDDAAALTAGRAPLGAIEDTQARHPHRLTVTFGFGPGLFAAAGADQACPDVIARFPTFPRDRLEKRWGQTDLVLQVCCDDATTLAYARRRLARDAAAATTIAWVQQGFTAAPEEDGAAPRNLMGFRDGSGNERDPAQIADVVWSRGHPTWLAGGTHLVLRRIRIDLDRWDDVETATKEMTFARRMRDGAPLTGAHETDVVDRLARDADGFTVVAPSSHAGRAQARTASERLHRRAFDYEEPGPEGVESGLLFAAFQADAATAFVPVQRRLDELDLLNTWTTHVGSAVFAVPPGIAPGEYVGQGLLGA